MGLVPEVKINLNLEERYVTEDLNALIFVLPNVILHKDVKNLN